MASLFQMVSVRTVSLAGKIQLKAVYNTIEVTKPNSQSKV
jgi:hypothetical protein